MTTAERHIEILARGVCVKDGKLLVCHTIGAKNTYLPGGHVDFHERARDGLSREILEELGVTAEVGRFLGAVEHAFDQKGERHCEINLVFEMKAEELDSSMAPESKEDYMGFLWLPIRHLSASDLEPSPLRELIPMWVSNVPGAVCWASTL